MKKVLVFITALFCALTLFACNSQDKTYTVKFVNYDGSVLQEEVLKENEMPEYKGETPVREGSEAVVYEFDGWDNEIVKVTKDVTYTAKFVEKTRKYTIKFVIESKVVLELDLEYGTVPVYLGSTPTKESVEGVSYVFDGWDSELSPVYEDKIYTAKFIEAPVQQVVNYVNYDGQLLQTETVNFGETSIYKGETPIRVSTVDKDFTFKTWELQPATSANVIEYKAVYTESVRKYLIKFVNYNDELLISSLVEYGTLPNYLLATPTRKADAQFTYTFDKWDSEIVKVTGVATYKAVYTATLNKYLVKFVNFDGSVLQSEQLNYGETPTYKGETPTREKDAQFTYTFDTWDKEIVSVSGEVIYKATYSETLNSYTVKFVNYEETELQSETLNYGVMPIYKGKTPTKPNEGEKVFYFDGWDKEIDVVKGDTVYKAVFIDTNVRTVKFVDYDGTELDVQQLEDGTTPVYKGKTPTREADVQYTYTFDGWDKPITVVTMSVTYKAVYTSTLNKYTVRFVNYDDAVLQTENLEYGTTPTYKGETPTKPSTAEFTYAFDTWDKEIVSVSGEITYKATYSEIKNKYTVKFVNWNDEILQTSEVEYGKTPIEPSSPSRPSDIQYSYTFDGWDKTIVVVTEAIIYKAQFTGQLNKYTVKFVNYDGTELQRSLVEYGTTPSYSGETPTKPSTTELTFTFDKWNSEIVAVTEEATYIATFTSSTRKYTVKFVNYDDSLLEQVELEYGEIPSYSKSNPTKPSDKDYNYKFVGWDKEIVAVTGDVVYKAKYTSSTKEDENWTKNY